MTSQSQIGANILKRTIEYLCSDQWTEDRADALEVCNVALESCFADEQAARTARAKQPTPKQAAFLFFLRNAGTSYDPQTQTKRQGQYAGARRLAKAERDARALGYTFDWQQDWSVDHQKEYDCYPNGGPETCEFCLMLSPEGNVVQSLGCIDDATKEYRRVVEAELALEQLG